MRWGGWDRLGLVEVQRSIGVADDKQESGQLMVRMANHCQLTIDLELKTAAMSALV